jgi:hypothetical protein
MYKIRILSHPNTSSETHCASYQKTNFMFTASLKVPSRTKCATNVMELQAQATCVLQSQFFCGEEYGGKQVCKYGYQFYHKAS